MQSNNNQAPASIGIAERKTEPAGSYSVVITVRLYSHREDAEQQQPGSCFDRNCCDEKIAIALACCSSEPANQNPGNMNSDIRSSLSSHPCAFGPASPSVASPWKRFTYEVGAASLPGGRRKITQETRSHVNKPKH
jgi:hypothetical protein